MSDFQKGWIITPGAKGFDPELQATLAFPVNIPIKVITPTDDRPEEVSAIEPHGKTIIFKSKDISFGGNCEVWDVEWERLTNPVEHRWDLIKLIEGYGNGSFIDWENGPHPCFEDRDFFMSVLQMCQFFEKPDEPLFNNALIDLTLLVFSEAADLSEVTIDSIESVVYTINQLLTCRLFVKSGINWSEINKDEWLNTLKSREE